MKNFFHSNSFSTSRTRAKILVLNAVCYSSLSTYELNHDIENNANTFPKNLGRMSTELWDTLVLSSLWLMLKAKVSPEN